MKSSLRHVWFGAVALGFGALPAACGGGAANETSASAATAGSTGSGGGTSTSTAASVTSASNASGTGGSTNTSSTGAAGGGGACVEGPTSAPWSEIGPGEGEITGLTVSANTLAIATIGGLLVSTDKGATWHPPADAAFSHLRQQMAATDTDLFATLPTDLEIYRSTDNGDHWTKANPGNFQQPFLYGTDGGVFASTGQGPQAYQWNAGTSSWDDLAVPAALISIAAAGTDIYAVTQAQTILAKHGAGAWNAVTPVAGVLRICASPGVVIASTFPGISRTLDQGLTWKQTTPFIVAPPLVATPSGFMSTNTSVQTSSDQGATWQLEQNGLPVPPAPGMAYGAANSTTLYVAGSGGLFQRPDAGPPNWSKIPVDALVMHNLVGDGNVLFAGDDYGVHLSMDQGASWTHGALITSAPTAIALGTSSALFIGTTSGIYRSDDAAKTWPQKSMGLPKPIPANMAAYGVTAFATTAATIYAGTGGNTVKVQGSNITAGVGVYQSIDNGETWTEAAKGLPTVGADANNQTLYDSIEALSVSGTTLVAGTLQKGVFLSNDGGATWADANGNLPLGPLQQPPTIVSIAIAGTDIVVATSGYFDPAKPATPMYQIFRSADQGKTWTNSGSGIPAGASVTAIVARGSMVFASAGTTQAHAAGDGVYASTDGGSTWSALTDGLEELGVAPLSIVGDTLYAGTIGRSVFKHSLNCAK